MSHFSGEEHLEKELKFSVTASDCTLTGASTWSQDLPNMLPRLWRFALIIVDSELFAEHLILEACTRIMNRRGEGRVTLSPFGSVYAEIYDVWKRENCKFPHPPEGGSPTRAYDKGLSFHRVGNGHASARPGWLSRMSTEQRIVMFLLYVEPHHYAEVGRMLGMPGSRVLKIWVEASQVLGLTRTARTTDSSQG